MEALRDIWQEALQGRPCVVVGSAPGPVSVASGEAVVVVNGAISSVSGVPDLWFLSGRSRPVNWGSDRVRWNQVMVSQGTNRHVRCIVWREILAGGVQAMTRRLAEQGTTFDRDVGLSLDWRRTLETTTFPERAHYAGQGGPRPLGLSMGLLAVVMAVWAGAPRVRMAGFSWRAGYAYLTTGGPIVRGHLQADEDGLARLVVRYGDRIQHTLRLPAAVIARVTTEMVGQEAAMAKRMRQAQPAATEPVPAGLKVRVTALGTYNNVLQVPGNILVLRDARHFSSRWMVWADPEAPVKQQSAREAAVQTRIVPTPVGTPQSPRLKPNGADLFEEAGPPAATGAQHVL